MIFVRPIRVNEWPEYRGIRLQALRDSPDAFGSTFEAEVLRTDADWSARIAASISSGFDRALFAFNHDQLCGLVWCKSSSSAHKTVDIFQMWVEPASRGSGASRALLNEALAWAEGMNAHRVRLGVTAADSPAMRLYKAYGFRPEGELQPLREGSDLMVQTMALELVIS